MVTAKHKLESEGFKVGKTREGSKARRKNQRNGIVSCVCETRNNDLGKFGDRALSGDKCKCTVSSGGRSFRVAKKIADNPNQNLEGLGSETMIPGRQLKGISMVFIQKKRN